MGFDSYADGRSLRDHTSQRGKLDRRDTARITEDVTTAGAGLALDYVAESALTAMADAAETASYAGDGPGSILGFGVSTLVVRLALWYFSDRGTGPISQLVLWLKVRRWIR